MSVGARARRRRARRSGPRGLRRPDLPLRTRWLADDVARSLWVVPFLVVAAFVVSRAPGVAGRDDAVALVLVLYAVLLLVYPVLTLVAFAGLSGERLTAALGEARRRQQGRSPWLRRMTTWRDGGVGGDGPSWPVMLALGSLGVAVWLVLSGATSPVLLTTSILMIVFAWGGSVVAYAVHAARLDALHGGLRFPGDEVEPGRAFGDYLYLALGVQAALGPSDVQVTTSRMRRTLSGHMLVGWIFNTVVVAALVSFLVGLG